MKFLGSIPLTRIALCLLGMTLTASLPRVAAAATDPPQQTTPNYTARLVNFQTSLGGSTRNFKIVTTTVRFKNTTKKPLILGYVHNSASVTDDQGNRYIVGRDSRPRGMGVIVGNQVDPKFVLRPAESANLMLELIWLPQRNSIYGTRYTLNLTVREINAVNGTQFQLGAENGLEFSGITDGNWSPGADTDAPSGAFTSPKSDTEGPFSTEVTELRTSKSNSGNNPKHVLTATVQFKNITDQPLILAYEAGSGLYIDEIGNRYDRDAENGHTVTGMGVVKGVNVDPTFVLQPGETRQVRFQLWRFIFSATQQIGLRDTFYAAIHQFEVLPSKQLREVRQYSLTFPGLTAENGTGALADPTSTPTQNSLQRVLGNIIRKRR